MLALVFLALMACAVGCANVGSSLAFGTIGMLLVFLADEVEEKRRYKKILKELTNE